MRKLIILCFCSILFGQSITIKKNITINPNVSIGGVGVNNVLISIQISPPNPQIPYTQSQTFTALGFFSNGSSGDITSLATWSSSSNFIASPQGTPPGNNLFQCNSRGTVTVTATYQNVAGNTSLTCQSPTFTPQGSINISQSNIAEVIVQFTGSNGTPPYTFSSSDLPGFLSLSNTGCIGTQVNCSLFGTPSIIGVYTFHIQAVDSLGNAACSGIGCAIFLNVVAAVAESNPYCDPSNHVIGLSQDGPALPLQHCYNTALVNTPTTPGQTIFVCPHGQIGVAQCNLTTIGANPNADVCYTVGGVWCPSLQSAMNYVYNGGGTPRCWDMQLYPTIDNNNPLSAVNDYTTPAIVTPGDIDCGPQFSRPYLWIRTTQFNNLPPLGNRVTPSWVKVSSVYGRPDYDQTSKYGIPTGYYLAKIRGEVSGNGTCVIFSSRNNSQYNGIRFMGLLLTCPHGRDLSVDQWGKNVCPLNLAGTPQCSPGWVGGMMEMGCDVVLNVECPTDSFYTIFDRVLMSGCDDITMVTCLDAAETIVHYNSASYMAIIDSYILHAFCMYAIGPCVDSHAISGGNPNNGVNDEVLKVVNSYVEATGENVFSGAGLMTPGLAATDHEIRTNHFLKPQVWKVDSPSFIGKVQDAWVQTENKTPYGPGTTCTFDPPLNGTTALCTVIIDVSGNLIDVLITNQGSGYGISTKANGNTFANNPNMYLTDSGVTYTSCKNQLVGNVNTVGTDVQWQKGNKFVAGLVGTQLTINNVNYLVTSFNNNRDLTISTTAGTQTNVDYNSNLPNRGDCLKGLIGFPNIKNVQEAKTVTRELDEGNVYEGSWNGQSDQDGYCILISPKNVKDKAPTAAAYDITFRYNICRNTVKGMQIANSPATQGESLSQGTHRISIHDIVFDGMNGVYFSTGTSPIQSTSNTVFGVANGDSAPYNLTDIKINHITAIGTIPAGFSLTAGSFINLTMNCQYPKNGTTPNVQPGFTLENSIGFGGVKDFSSKNNGCLGGASSQSAKDQVPAHGPTEVALRHAFVNDFMLPVGGGNYTGGQVVAMLVSDPGACTVPPTTCSFTGGGGSGATCLIATKGVSPNIQVCQSTPGCTTAPIFPGQNYTSAPTVVINGTCPTPPVITAYIAGAGNTQGSSGCFDHNGQVSGAWLGIVDMTPDPIAQLDPANNICDFPAGGGNLRVSGANPTAAWQAVKFVNLPFDPNGAECNGINCAPGDLHLQAGSPFHNKANDGLDMGANIDLVLGTSTGTPSPYTGCFITAGSYKCPQ